MHVSKINYLCCVLQKKRFFIKLSYDGTHYHGWQIQKNAISVQEILNKSLSVVFRQLIETTGCGRTDTGVHAKEFFVHFDMEERSMDMNQEPWTLASSGV